MTVPAPVSHVSRVLLALLSAGLGNPADDTDGRPCSRRLLSPPYLPLCVERLGPGALAVAHYGELNGDMMRDPEMTFYRRGDDYYAASWRNDYAGVDQVSVEPGPGGGVRPRQQAEHTAFWDETWAPNVLAQHRAALRALLRTEVASPFVAAAAAAALGLEYP